MQPYWECPSFHISYKKEFQARSRWNALLPEERELKLQALAKMRKSIKTRQGNGTSGLLATLIGFFLTLSLITMAGCDLKPAFAYTDNQLADAIFKSEGDYKATYLYGIRSIPYKNEADARRICLNTIKNQRKRHLRHDCGKDYLACLAERYCPTTGKLSHTERKVNSYWLVNVQKFLKKGVN